LDEHIFLNAPNARILENALGGDTFEFPSEIWFSSVFSQRSSNAGLTMIKAQRAGGSIRVCVQLGCFNNISLGLRSSYYYLHVKFKKGMTNALKRG